jgi:2-oxoisovalerate dehydrogenase E2 component (dihydrolipoyl transacylase)
MMTDKATVEMESPVTGVVVELAGDVGDTVAIGSTLAVIETEGEESGETAQAPLVSSEVETRPVAGANDPSTLLGMSAAGTKPVRPEPVEGLSFSFTRRGERDGGRPPVAFDSTSSGPTQ